MQNPNLGEKQPMHWCTLGADCLRRNFSEKVLRRLVDKMIMSQQSASAAEKASSILGCTESTASRSGGLSTSENTSGVLCPDSSVQRDVNTLE